ncbi:hypothetical protein IW140_003790 [Coemansia sp. RSA 1813]|nr:hypothetical protein EV178_003496 [Coemansia sp. RSA 1646]KAJ1766669.1 hypothetical protein LPJ74_005768 [Coemansia sp. RSA 1843]KAJ2088683.1 hypothetical protein IW138_004065 [Coemansia sp. RSA 986]KAJ2213112.1 hypothetical protein EV179_004082 [Coemansia sp. RSA 487]KAJ2568584.1 hypothetical protein IW140_003790 [Coemansia sp. RSA 1813]
MPSRVDRRRNMQALAKFHGLRFDYAQTFDATRANALGRASGYATNGTHLACYLSHLGVYKRMVEEGIETALILEDDVDMEIDLKQRHALIMDQAYKRYKGDWDMLYLGHCTSDASEPGMASLDTANGAATASAVPGGNGRAPLFIEPADRAAFLQRDLTLYLAEYPMCLHAYAVTRECAKRLAVLLEERLRTVGQDIDLVLAVGVEYGMTTVLGASPPYMVQVGRQELPSDLTMLRDGDTAQRLLRSTLYHLNLRVSNPQTLPPYMDWLWFKTD